MAGTRVAVGRGEWQGLGGKHGRERRWGGSGELSLEVPVEVGEVPHF